LLQYFKWSYCFKICENSWITLFFNLRITFINFIWITIVIEPNWVLCIFMFETWINCDPAQSRIAWSFCVPVDINEIRFHWTREQTFPSSWWSLSSAYCQRWINLFFQYFKWRHYSGIGESSWIVQFFMLQITFINFIRVAVITETNCLWCIFMVKA
jgi:hypothetical protein